MFAAPTSDASPPSPLNDSSAPPPPSEDVLSVARDAIAVEILQTLQEANANFDAAERETPPSALSLPKRHARRGRTMPVGFSTDENDTEIALVTLPSGDVTMVDKADWLTMSRRCHAKNWLMHDDGKGHRYVRATSPRFRGGVTCVARLILRANKGDIVSHVNFDPLDLRRKNLNFKRMGSSTTRREITKAQRETVQ